MHKPNSAIERIKNHLAYKLGKVMIDFSHQRNNYKYGGGYIALFKKLYQINKQHKKEQKIYQQTIQVFPQLKYPNLETCSDYEQALKYKFHLSYMLGEVLIQTFQNLHKGSMFKLAKNIKKANKEFKIFREIFDQLKIHDIKIHKDFVGNKCLFLEKFPRMQNILKIHKYYQPILDNIFHNFNYFMQNFDLIEEWLLSNDFNEKYKKENHPYPSLLDPKKLNDEKEKINYKNIPAELAWEMNLPLPDNYKFVFLSAGVSGHAAMVKFLEDCNCRLFSKYSHRGNNIFGVYCDQYAFLNKKGFNILTFFEYGIVDYKLKSKFIGLFNSKKRVLFLVRDPIERLKSRINHIAPNKFAIYDFNLNSNVKEIVNVKKYYSKNGINDFPDINILENLLTFNFFCYKLLIDFFRKSHIFYIDMEEIKPTKAFDTMCVLADKFGFKRPVDKINFNHIVFDDTIGYFPMRLHVEDMIIIITTLLRVKQMRQSKEYINFTKEFFDKPLKYENLGIFLKPQELERLRQDSKLFDATKRYLNNFIEALEERIELEKAKLFKEKDVLNYLKENKELRIKLKNILDKELVHIKQHRPDIVASWKYYQEFEKMCKELDSNI
ncbi:DUF2972 domain-containing protein [Campylobacter jejuni]|uniref:DUF2972 domain-containing protein n=1 Tax=Campylobacter jejuni TaxID=197 RepID=UPI001387F6CC|nr:DUF2972 domain-containing protein [Campylobacter jejuni]EAH4946439.1 DUF2972 domain-containing protein [Campylobacter jejuni]EAK7187307.1 DUF2972 domain-containing protein [Campylobacter jejuni]EIO9650884.1 DUF2972 domain-containing protein [Campylobacter jejuni]WHN07967.1 DUF2972 domain-containing protein [Campylobacter jejuni]HDZ5227976.1 DUF2972 domain-containing protein [Campylobacter jejuni]